MDNKTDLYSVLGVSPTSDAVVIRAAFKALMLKYHPDTNQSAGANQRAVDINEAFAILGDPIKRRQYDAERQARPEQVRRESAQKQNSGSGAGGWQTGTTGEGRTAQPPPPPRPHVAAASSQDHSGRPLWKRPGGWVAALLVIGFIKLAANTSTLHRVPTAYVGENVAAAQDKMLVPADSNPAPSGGSAAAPASGAAEMPNVFQSPTALAYGDIESAAQNFDRILQKSGIIGARAFSEACHKGVAANPTWPAADRCAAFDYSASFIDEGMTKAMGVDPDGYFAFQKDNQADNYQPVGGVPYMLGQRLQAIQKAANSAVYDAVSTRISRSEAARARQAQNAASNVTIPSDNVANSM